MAAGVPVRDWVAQSGPWAPLTYLISKALIFIFIPVAGYPLNVAIGRTSLGLFWGLVLAMAGDPPRRLCPVLAGAVGGPSRHGAVLDQGPPVPGRQGARRGASAGSAGAAPSSG